jgi:hypothetical protein
MRKLLLAAWLLVYPLNPPDDYVGTGSEGGLEEAAADFLISAIYSLLCSSVFPLSFFTADFVFVITKSVKL